MFGMVLSNPLSYYDSICYYNTDENTALPNSETKEKYKMDSISDYLA